MGVSPKYRLGYLPCLDGLRALAVLAVMVYHAGPSLLPGGFLGVDVFYVLSGFLITALLLKDVDEHGSIRFRSFYLRRILRLTPALLLVVGASIAYRLVIGNDVQSVAVESLIVLGYVSNWTRAFEVCNPAYLGHTWSLSMEEQFYLVWPGLLSLVLGIGLTRRAAGFVIACAAVGIALLRFWMHYQGASFERIYNGLDTRADSLLIGACAAFLIGGDVKLKAWPGRSTLLTVCAYVAVVGMSGLLLRASPGHPLLIRYLYFGFAVATAFLVVAMLNGRVELLRRLVEWSPVVWVGRISYGLYLWHYPVFQVLEIDHGCSPLTILAVGAPTALVLAAISYYAIELPVLAFKNRFA